MIEKNRSLNFFGNEFSHGQLLNLVSCLAESLSDIEGKEILIHSENQFDRLLWLLAVLHAGGHPILDEAKLHNPNNFPTVLTESIPDDALLNLVDSNSSWKDVFSETNQMTFSTSGSTGDATQVCRGMGGLLAEVRELEILYDVDGTGCIASLVSPLHVYGFLHCILLPLLTGTSVLFVDPMELDLPTELPSRFKLLVTVPALWQFTKGFFEQTKVQTMITSAGSFGEDRAKQLSQLANAPTQSFEVFGSTETGGIGYRTLNPYEASFTKFSNVLLEAKSSGTRVLSPFLYPLKAIVIADKFTEFGESQFCFDGRFDQVIKYSGHRISLQNLEKQLAEICQVPVKCLYFEDHKRAQGGHLIAIVESPQELDLLKIKIEYNTKFSSPGPSQYFQLGSFPINQNGKTTKQALLAAIKFKN